MNFSQFQKALKNPAGLGDDAPLDRADLRHRIKMAAKALKPYKDADDTFCPLVDILTDLRHYAASSPLLRLGEAHTFEDALRQSLEHFNTEKTK